MSVVVPTFQRRDLLIRTVLALRSETFTQPFEVVVVVDGSTDGSAEALRSMDVPFSLTVLEQRNSGAAAARNRGAEHAHGHLLLFLDDDMEPEPSLLAEHDRSHREGAELVLGHVPIHPNSPRTFLSSAVARWADERARRLSLPGAVPGVRDLLTGQMSIGRDLFWQLGGFETEFRWFGNEDLEFGLRVADAGCRIVFNPQAVSKQHYVVTPRLYLRQRRQLGAADVLLARRRPELAGMLLHDAREASIERFVLRWLRPLLTSLLLAAFAARRDRIGIRWFSRVRRLEYLQGVRDAGGLPARRSVRVLCYHSIAKRRDALAPYGIPLAQFRAQIDFLGRYFRFITGEEFLRLLDGTGGVPRRAMLLTFDDCYRDLLDAASVLADRAMPAVAFAVTRRLGGTNDWDRVLAEQVPLLDAGELANLARLRVTVGSHTRTHPKLTHLEPQEARDELGGSLEDLSALGVRFLPLLAYPYGLSDERVRTLAAEVGYRAAFTVEPGIVDPSMERFALPRIEILRSDRGPIFWWKVWGPRHRFGQRPRASSLQSTGATRKRRHRILRRPRSSILR